MLFSSREASTTLLFEKKEAFETLRRFLRRRMYLCRNGGGRVLSPSMGRAVKFKGAFMPCRHNCRFEGFMASILPLLSVL